MSDARETTIEVSGSVLFDSAAAFWRRVRTALQEHERAVLDLSKLELLGGAAASMLHDLKQRAANEGKVLEWVGANDAVARQITLYAPSAECHKEAPCAEGMIRHLGRSFAIALQGGRDLLVFVGAMTASALAALRDLRSVAWNSVPGLLERAGPNGVPIVALINFLIGVILAIQAKPQLERFGADIFVADAVGLALVRELAPLMTAIIVAGRSGAAYAAELGTMKVSEEIDALRSMGFDPLRQLVFPRIVALAIAVPILTALADVVGIAGGWLIAVTTMDITTSAFILELSGALDLSDVFGGLFKSFVFAILIALVACERGLQTRGGAEGVGRTTTAAVVAVLFGLVALSAVFAWLYELLGI